MSLKKLVARIEAENEIFDSLSKAEKRVRIAQDCLERIKLNLISPYTNNFLYPASISVLQMNSNLKESVNSNIQCSACAKGGLFLSYVGRVNNFDSCKLVGGNDVDDSEHKKLLEIFTLRQLALIEFAFEGNQYLNRYWDKSGENSIEIKFSEKLQINAYNFCRRYDVKERLIAICENIIENKGTFKL